MANTVAVGTDICADLPSLIDTSLDCSLCTIGFPQFGGRFGVSFHTSNFCPPGAVGPAPSIWLNGMYTQFGQLKCKQPGNDSEPDPGLFAGIGQFSGIGYTNPLTGRGSSHKFRYTVEVRPTSEYTLDVNWICQVIGPRSVWYPYSALRFEMVEVLGPNDNPSIPYRNRQYVPTSGTSYTQWKGETFSYPPPGGAAKGDIYTTEWSRGLNVLPSPFPPQTPGGWAFMWTGTKWEGSGALTRWDIEKKRADNGQGISLRRYVPIAVDTSIAGTGDGITSAMFTLGLESMREGCGGGGNEFPDCGMWFPTLNDSYGSGWHTCFRVITQHDGKTPVLSTIGADTPDCGKVFRVDDGTIQYGPFCGCDKLEMTAYGKWRSLKNDDLPCFFPEVAQIGVPGEDTAKVQEIQTNGTGSIIIKQLDGGKIWACYGSNFRENPDSPDRCTLADWEFVEVTNDKVVATGSPYVYRLRFEQNKLTMWLHSLRFPSDPIMPDACAPQTPPAWKWTCVNGSCEPSPDGQYQTLAECQTACEPPPAKKWWCVGGACVESATPPVGNTGGPWDTAEQCAAGCQPPPDPPVDPVWVCIFPTENELTCVQKERAWADEHGVGYWDTEELCNQNCNGPVWVCLNGTCVSMSLADAQLAGYLYWPSWTQCNDNCQTPTNPYQGYYCVPETNPIRGAGTPYTCIQWGGTQGPPAGATGGKYTTLEDCVASCAGSPDPEEPGIPYWCVEAADGSRACGRAVTAPPATLSGPYLTQAECDAACQMSITPESAIPAPAGLSLHSISSTTDRRSIERLKLPCVNLGASKGQRKMDCRCGYVEVFECKKHGECTRIVQGLTGVPVCATCPDYSAPS